MMDNIHKYVTNFENASIYGVSKGGPKVVLSWTQLEEVIAYFLANGSKHVGGKRQTIRDYHCWQARDRISVSTSTRGEKKKQK